MRKIELIPAIDIIDGQCVRLTKGDYDTKRVYGNPVDMALQFQELGFSRLHVVDLDGAKSRHVVNDGVLRDICRLTNLTVDFGGGVKTEDDLRRVFDAGAAMVTVGSIAITHPEVYLAWMERYGAEHLILGADVRNGRVSINGWKEDSDVALTDFLTQYMQAGNRNVLCTEISRDGMLQGPAIDLYREIMQAHPTCHLIASGGVSSIEDIEALDQAGIPAVVFGKAIYEGRIDLKELKVKN
jgi:phosphoribosylformimino-5-aminoimidazole carboxamide ribotide isomerase